MEEEGVTTEDLRDTVKGCKRLIRLPEFENTTTSTECDRVV